jgi:hypothetical protein
MILTFGHLLETLMVFLFIGFGLGIYAHHMWMEWRLEKAERKDRENK